MWLIEQPINCDLYFIIYSLQMLCVHVSYASCASSPGAMCLIMAGWGIYRLECVGLSALGSSDSTLLGIKGRKGYQGNSWQLAGDQGFSAMVSFLEFSEAIPQVGATHH